MARSATDKYFGIALLLVAIAFFGWVIIGRFGFFDRGVEQVTISEEIMSLPDGTKYLVHPSKLLSGGPPKGGIGVDRGIPALLNPKFISASGATWLNDDDLVFGVFLDGVAKAYPKQILVWHEIANDEINGEPILVTYCPLCGTGIAFERTIDGEVYKFGISGKLLNSNLVMYDDKTESYWTQVGGKAIVGPFTGTELKQIPIDTMLWKDWKELHADTLALSKDTGMSRPYGTDPYGNYYINTDVGFGAQFNDTRLHPKAMVSGVVVDNMAKAYPVVEVGKAGDVVNDKIGEFELLIVKDPGIETGDGFEINPMKIFDRKVDGTALEFEIRNNKLFDGETFSEWSFDGVAISGELKGKKLELIESTSAMWFSWLSFNPTTELYLSK